MVYKVAVPKTQLPTKILIISSASLVILLFVKFYAFGKIVTSSVESQKELVDGNDIRELYLKLPFPLDFKVYFFNVSNPMEVTMGAKPILKEIGPYGYDVWKSKEEVVDNVGDDSLTYKPKEIYYFNQNKTGEGLSENDYVTILHPLIGGVISAIASRPVLWQTAEDAITQIFNPTSVYLTAKVKDILFDGITVNCTQADFAGKAVCSQLKMKMQGVKELASWVYSVSVLGGRNNTLGKEIKVKRGVKEPEEIGSVTEYDKMKDLKKYYDKEPCSKFHGTDGWIFPAELKPEQGIWVFATDVCRNLHANYVSDSSFKGVPTRIYAANLGDESSNEEDKCYCATPDSCMKKGVVDLTKCIGAPIYATLPHFTRVDTSFLEQVDGMHPDDKYQVKLIFEPVTGVPMSGEKQMQFNLPIAPIPEITVVKNISTSLHPIFWINESVDLQGPLLQKIKRTLMLLSLASNLLWGLITLSIIGICIGSWRLYKKEYGSGKITSSHNLQKILKQKEKDAKKQNSNGVDNPNFGKENAF